MPHDAPVYDEIMARLRSEFLDDAGYRLDAMDGHIVQAFENADDQLECLAGLRREAHSFKGLGGTFGYPAITLIAHRLEDYLAAATALSEREAHEVQQFVDRMRDIVERRDEPGQDETNRILRSLPMRWHAEAANVRPRDTELLVVTPGKVVGQLVKKELQARGFRVVTTSSPLDALNLAVRTKPGMVIASAVLDRIGGVDLARALAAMSITREVPFVLLTSFQRGHPELDGLPANAVVLRSGAEFSEDIAAALLKFHIM